MWCWNKAKQVEAKMNSVIKTSDLKIVTTPPQKPKTKKKKKKKKK